MRVVAALVPGLLLFVGCSGTHATFGGRITSKGKPLDSGVIMFHGPAPEYRMGMGTISDDGAYTATDVPIGQVLVSVRAPGLDAKYLDHQKSGLSYTIKSGMTTLDIVLP
jgi:hypothetical protein